MGAPDRPTCLTGPTCPIPRISRIRPIRLMEKEAWAGGAFTITSLFCNQKKNIYYKPAAVNKDHSKMEHTSTTAQQRRKR